MKALILKEYGCLVYEEVPEPHVGADDVLIQVKACGICGSDVQGMDGTAGRRIPPIIMGHEAAGLVADVGADVSDWHTGDRVTFDSTIYCGNCYFCRRGLINLCDNRRVVGVSTRDFRCHGALAEYVAVPQRILHRIPDAVSFVQATMAEPLSVALHAVSRSRASVNDTAVVVGAGTIGLCVVQCLRVTGCGQIFAVDIQPHRLALACQLGADRGLRSDRDDVVAEVLRCTANHGADVVIEAVGATAATGLGLKCLRKGGTLAVLGGYPNESELPLLEVVLRQLSLNGSVGSCWEFPTCLDLIARGAIKLEPMISAVSPLADGASWFERLRQREEGLLKVILEP